LDRKAKQAGTELKDYESLKRKEKLQQQPSPQPDPTPLRTPLKGESHKKANYLHEIWTEKQKQAGSELKIL
jgi:hypothetical protein